MVPLFCCRKIGASARNTVKVPLRWVSMTGSHSSSDMLNSIRSRRMPATHTTPSMRPKASIPDCTIERTPSLDVTQFAVPDGARRFLAVHGYAIVVDHHGRALGCRRQRDRPADAAPAARNRDHLAVE